MWILGTTQTLRKFDVQLTPLHIDGRPVEMPRLQDGEVVIVKVYDADNNTHFICNSFEEMQSAFDYWSNVMGVHIAFFSTKLVYDLIHYYDPELTGEFIRDFANHTHTPAEVIDAIKIYAFDHPHLAVHFCNVLCDCASLDMAEDLVGVPVNRYTITDAQRIIRESQFNPAEKK